MTTNKPVFILVRPQMGENIGAAARAMWNFGFKELRLVAPRDGWPNRMAEDRSSGALAEISEVRVFGTIEEAAADLEYLYAVTARPRTMAKPVVTPQEAAATINAKAGFVFGPERTGLENDEAALCHAILTIPTNPDFAALNLAQSVLLLAWELFKAGDKTAGKIDSHEPAPYQEFDQMFARLQTELENGEFFKGEHIKPTMLRNIRTMFLRGQWSEQEIRTFQGMLTALKRSPKD